MVRSYRRKMAETDGMSDAAAPKGFFKNLVEN